MKKKKSLNQIDSNQPVLDFEITASIVTYNTDPDSLNKAINSFLRARMKTYLYVIDNSPNDYLKNHIPVNEQVEYIYTNANLGFGKAHNIAMNKSLYQSKYHLILNPDVYFGEGVIEDLYKTLEADSTIGLISPKILYSDNSIQYSCRLIPSPFEMILRRLPTPFPLLKAYLNNNELRFTNYNKVMEVPFLLGCFLLIRNEALRKVGVFDEQYFMYMEDLDISRRINYYYKTIYYPKVTIYHEYAQDSKKKLKIFLYHLSSMIKYFNKWGWFFDKNKLETNKRILRNLKANQQNQDYEFSVSLGDE